MNRSFVNTVNPYEWMPMNSFMFLVYNNYARMQMFEEAIEHKNTLLRVWLN